MRLLAAFVVVLATCGLVVSAGPRAWSAGIVRSARVRQPAPPLLQSATKLVVVSTPGWDRVRGTLSRYQRKDGRWERLGNAIPIVVGRNGMAWDPGLWRDRAGNPSGPIKHEGDGRSPAGVFALTQTFGYAGSLPGSTVYVPLTPLTECVDDAASSHYAQLVERNAIANVDWSSAEQMRRNDELYRWGVVVDYNMSRTVPGAGSCIFLHIWSGPDRGTAGCTAMAPDDITAVVNWIDGTGRAVLVQLPASEYSRVRTAWALP